MHKALRPLVVLLLFVLPALVLAAEEGTRVLILANRDDGESLSVARHYAEKRGLPETSIVALPMPLTEQITWREFVVSIWNPLLREAIARGDVDAIAMDLEDEIGRTKIAPSGHLLDALVICRGVPLRIAHDPALYDARSNPLTANTLPQSVIKRRMKPSFEMDRNTVADRPLARARRHWQATKPT